MFRGKSGRYAEKKFLTYLRDTVPVGLWSTYDKDEVFIDRRIWQGGSKYIMELDRSLRLTGQRSYDAPRILSFFTKVLEDALVLKTQNPDWFP